MTIEQLLGCSADQLEAMTEQQKLEYFAPYLDITRPDRAAAAKSMEKKSSKKIDPALQAIDMLTKMGIDFSKL